MNTLTKAIESWETLRLEEKEMAIELFRKNIIELKRDKLAVRVGEAKENYKAGKVNKGSTSDLFKDLDNV